MRGLAEGPTELAAEVGRGEVRGAGESRDVERRAVTGVDKVVCAQEVPGRVGVASSAEYRVGALTAEMTPCRLPIGYVKPVGYLVKDQGRLDATFAALADPTRRAILARLASGEASVTELAEPFAMSQPAISKHLKVLERAGLISRGRDAQRRPCRLEAEPLAEATEWLEGYRRILGGQLRAPRRPARRAEGPRRRTADAPNAKGDDR